MTVPSTAVLLRCLKSADVTRTRTTTDSHRNAKMLWSIRTWYCLNYMVVGGKAAATLQHKANFRSSQRTHVVGDEPWTYRSQESDPQTLEEHALQHAFASTSAASSAS